MKSFCVILLVLLAASVHSADSIWTFSGNTYIEDTYLDYQNPTTEYNEVDTFIVQNSIGVAKRGLVVCYAAVADSFPASGTVVAVACTLALYGHAIIAGGVDTCKQLTKTDVDIKDCNWNDWNKGRGDKWGGAGCTDTADQECAIISDSTANGGYDLIGPPNSTLSITTTTGWWKFPIDTCYANAYISGTYDRFGFVLSANAFIHTTFEGTENTNKPKVIIAWNYTPPPSGPPNRIHGPGGAGQLSGPDGPSYLGSP
jgi:hypothetical protein